MQQYDQRRLRLFAVVLFLGIMAANLGRYLIFDGLYLWDARRHTRYIGDWSSDVCSSDLG